MAKKAVYLSNDVTCGNLCGHPDSVGNSKFPYRKAHYRHQQNGGKVRYYIEFSAWQPHTAQTNDHGKLVRKRYSYDLNELYGPERDIRAKYLVSKINQELEQGLILPPKDSGDGQLIDNTISRMTIKQAIIYGIQIKTDYSGLREATISHYGAISSVFCDWLRDKKYADLNIKQLTKNHLYEFMDYLLTDRKCSNKTYNNYKSRLSALMNTLIDRQPDLFPINPMRGIKQLKVSPKKHSALNDKQMQRALMFFKQTPKRAHIALFVQFMYYSLARINELILLKVGDIDIENRVIHIRNSKTEEGYCGIPAALAKLIIENKICQYPEHYYVFGHQEPKGPGPVPYHKDTFYERNKYMLKMTGLGKLDKRFTLYSYKHSGAISLYRATKDIKLLQRQMRHKRIEQTSAYLRDLGQIDEFNGLDDWEGAI